MIKHLSGAAIGVVLFSGTAMAQCATYSFPYTLTNGSTADANQVMADFQAIGNCAAPIANPSFTGNVGVGTTAPRATIDARGSIWATSGGSGGGLYFRGPSNNTVIDPSLLYEGVLSGNGTAALPWGLNLLSEPFTYGADFMTFHAGTYQFRIPWGGNVNESVVATLNGTGFGLFVEPQYTLHVNGSTWSTTGWGGPSDGRLKTNVEPIADALALVNGLRGVRFQWRPAADRPVGKEMALPEGPQLGFIAQEVAAVVPEAVMVPKDPAKMAYGLKEADLIPVLVEALKQQQAEIEQLRAGLAALRRGDKTAP